MLVTKMVFDPEMRHRSGSLMSDERETPVNAAGAGFEPDGVLMQPGLDHDADCRVAVLTDRINRTASPLEQHAAESVDTAAAPARDRDRHLHGLSEREACVPRTIASAGRPAARDQACRNR